MIICWSQKFNTISQSLEKPSLSLESQSFIPFNNKTKQGWCDFHKRWEYVTIYPNNQMFFSCGIPLPSSIGLTKTWNKNQYEFYVDLENLVIRVNEKWSYLDVYEKQIYHTQSVCSKIIDFKNGRISHPENFDIKQISTELNNEIMTIILRLCKKIYDVDFHVENTELRDFVRYPSCPEFSKIEKKIDNIRNFNFRNDLNLFKDFCKLIQIKTTKQLRKDFHKTPELIFLHAFAQYLGFTNSDAIRTLVSDENIYNIFITNDFLRFSIIKRSVYARSEKPLLDGLRLWVQNARTNKTESVIAKRLIKFFKDTNINIILDAIDIYYYNAIHLPVAFHERILKEGFTLQMHNQLIQYFAQDENDDNYIGYTSDAAKYRNKEIKYSQDILRFEDFVAPIENDLIKKDYESIKENRLMMLKAQKNQSNNSPCYDKDEVLVTDDYEVIDDEPMEMDDLYKFEEIEKETAPTTRDYNLGKDIMKRGTKNSYFFAIPRNTDELYEISTKMRNCVGYLYRDKVLSLKSIIVVLIVENKMKACIEVQQDMSTYRYVIRQASGPANASINRKYYYPIEEWKRRHNIEGEIRYKL